jgi:hypothetical protein
MKNEQKTALVFDSHLPALKRWKDMVLTKKVVTTPSTPEMAKSNICNFLRLSFLALAKIEFTKIKYATQSPMQ